MNKRKNLFKVTKEFILEHYEKLIIVSFYLIAAIVSFIYYKNFNELESITNEQKNYYESIAADIWFKGISSLNEEKIENVEVTYTSDNLDNSEFNSIYERGLSNIQNDNISITITFKDFTLKQKGNEFEIFLAENSSKTCNAKIICSDNEFKTTTYKKIDLYWFTVITSTFLGSLIGGTILAMLLGLIITLIIEPIQYRFLDKKNLLHEEVNSK